MPEKKPSFDIYLRTLDDDQPLETLIVGHTVLERLLLEIIFAAERRKPNNIETFYRKLRRAEALKAITHDEAKVLGCLNRLRNRFAHEMSARVTFAELQDLGADMVACGMDFSDDWYDKANNNANQHTGVSGAIVEILNELYFVLAERLTELGGADYRGA